jgi:hypothetical protein
MRIAILLNAVLAAVLVLTAACGKRRAARPPLTFPLECEVLAGAGERTDSIAVAVFDTVDPSHAPWARNAGELLVFRLLYETLITIDCLGDVQQGLAVSWEKGDGGRRWTFELRDGARFWDGTRVTAGDVANSWRRVAVEPLTEDAGIDSVILDGDRVLHVYFERRHRHVPRALSANSFAVAKRSADANWRWRVGSGPYQIVTTGQNTPAAHKRTLTMRPAFGRRRPIIQFVRISTAEARDLLESVVDVMVTADPAVIEYAANRGKLVTVAMPWDRTYVLLSTSRVGGLREGKKLADFSSRLSDELARDAVRSEARGCRPPFWWDDVSDCSEMYNPFPWLPRYTEGANATQDNRRILYEADDPVARDLADRIVALAAADSASSADAAALAASVPGLVGARGGTIAEGVSKRVLESSLRYGDDLAYIIPVPLRPADPCYEARFLVARALWLAAVQDGFPESVLPLVDTRPHVIANGAKVDLASDWYGIVFIATGKSRIR